MSNSLDPDQDQHFVGPDLGPNCLQRLSADDKSRRQQGKSLAIKIMNKNRPFLPGVKFGKKCHFQTFTKIGQFKFDLGLLDKIPH